jgi:arylsulfatase A-like enzyme
VLSRRQLLTRAAAPFVLRGAAARPNVVFILADDLGYADLSCYGRRDYRTPNIDRLAAGGVRFTQAYANSAVCSATRTALITGRYQYRLPVGLEEPIPTTSERDPGLPPEHPTLPSILRGTGYATHLVGKWHLGRLPKYGPLQSGYDHFWGFRGPALDYFTHKNSASATAPGDLWDDDVRIDRAGYMTDLLGDRAVSVIENGAKSGKPFLLSLHFNAPHWPWEGPGDEAVSKGLTDLMHHDGGSLKTYARIVGRMDEQVGRVMQALERSGAAGNTIVVFTSDNGGERFSDTWPFTGKKGDLLEGGLRVPAIVRWPGRVKAGGVTEQVGMTMDWLPTLADAAGARADAGYPSDGISLLPWLTGSRAPMSRKVFWRYRWNGQRAVRDGDWKWLKIAENTFLFNVATDPLERANLKEHRPEVAGRLAREWDEWNAGMLPEDPGAYTYAMYADEVADHYGNVRKK